MRIQSHRHRHGNGWHFHAHPFHRDPHGSFRALKGADPVYQLFGAPAFTQTKLREPDGKGVLAFYMRPGLHGIHTEDWDEALSFFDRTVLKPASK